MKLEKFKAIPFRIQCPVPILHRNQPWQLSGYIQYRVLTMVKPNLVIVDVHKIVQDEG